MYNQSGFSIVATVMIMMILALFAAAAVSLITTAAGTGIQEERGTQAFYIADGGMQYTLKKNTYPYYAVASTNLGDGSFTVSVPTLTSNAAIDATSLSVSSTDGFTAAPDSSYWIMLCDTQAPDSNPIPPISATASTCEKISCTSKFSDCARGKDGTVAVAHLQNAVVMMYSWATWTPQPTLAQALPAGAKCTGASPKICVSSTAGFATSGFIRINNATITDIEDVFYDGKWMTGDPGVNPCGGGCTACLGTNGCTRLAYGDFFNDNDGDYKDDSLKGKAQPSGTAIYQSEFSVLVTSTGVIPGAILTGNIKRVVQGSILSLKDP